MIQLYAELHHIDYGKLISRIQGTRQEQKKKLSSLLLKTANLIPIALKPFKTKITNAAAEYGLFFTVLKYKGVTLVQEKTGGRNMLNISASIEKIEWDKLANIINAPAKKPGGGDSALREAAKIVKPFIAETMDTIPPSAIAELFDLLARDKIIGLADRFGVVLSDISVKEG